MDPHDFVKTCNRLYSSSEMILCCCILLTLSLICTTFCLLCLSQKMYHNTFFGFSWRLTFDRILDGQPKLMGLKELLQVLSLSLSLYVYIYIYHLVCICFLKLGCDIQVSSFLNLFICFLFLLINFISFFWSSVGCLPWFWLY